MNSMPVDPATNVVMSVPQEQAVLTSSTQFNPNAWDHWLLLGVVLSVSVWTLHTSWQWRRDWKQQGLKQPY